MDKQIIKEQVMKPLLDAGYQAYFVGGCVRDKVMSIKPHDYDIVTNATPEQIHTVFDKFVDINSEAFGITVVNVQGENVEIATFRKDRECDGRHTEVTYASTMEEDAVRRDLTINALYEDIDGKIYDPTGYGINDIQHFLIRFIGNTKDRCYEDNLRILRAYRFKFKLNFEFQSETLQDMYELLHTKEFTDSFKKRVSPERIGKEMRALFQSHYVFSSDLEAMVRDTEALEIFPKELYQLIDQPVHTEYHDSKDNFQHTMKAFRLVEAHCRYEIRLAILFHDLGKAVVQEPSGRAPKHELYSADITRKFLKERYKFDNKETDTVVTVVKNHMTMHQLHEHKHLYKTWKFLSQFDEETKGRLEMMLEADCQDSKLEQTSYEKYCMIPVLDFMLTHKYPADITGKDFIKAGLEPGPKMKRAIELANDTLARKILATVRYGEIQYVSKDTVIKEAIHAVRQ